MLSRIKQWARALRRDGHALYLASRDPRVPWFAKALALFVAGYALSPIDLIPDFIPVLGYLDDLVIVPLGIWVVVKMIAPEVMAEHRAATNKFGEAGKCHRCNPYCCDLDCADGAGRLGGMEFPRGTLIPRPRLRRPQTCQHCSQKVDSSLTAGGL
jgi:uncharacterized membrane protein YkvA (DUF1232 family)